MISDDNFAIWLRMMGPIRLYIEGDDRPQLVAGEDGRETLDVPFDQEVEPLELQEGVTRAYCAFSRPNGTPAAQLTQTMTFFEPGSTFTLRKREIQEALR